MPRLGSRLSCIFSVAVASSFIGFGGCTHPSADNIRLRKLNQDLQGQVSKLTALHESDGRIIDGLRKRLPTAPTLPSGELKNLWVATGIDIGRMTGGIDLDPSKPGDEGLRIYVSPTSESGQSIQAAGSFVVEAFDLAEKGDNRLGRWTWDPVAAKALWRAFLIEFGYELTCPWQTVPKHPNITIRVTFTDELTHIPYVSEKLVKVNLPPPPASAPASAPAK